jgi:hypothetical protein
VQYYAVQGTASEKEKHEQSIDFMAPKLSVRTCELGKVGLSAYGAAEGLDDQALSISCGW